jgi:hypothetical protein
MISYTITGAIVRKPNIIAMISHFLEGLETGIARGSEL